MIVEIIQIKNFFSANIKIHSNKVLDQQDLKLSKKLISSYKKKIGKRNFRQKYEIKDASK